MILSDIEELAKKLNIDFWGVASIERFNNAPMGRKPTDILFNAKSVIAIGIQIPKGALVAQMRFYEGYDPGKFVYLHYGVQIPNTYLEIASINISRFLEKEYGWVSVPLPPSQPYDRANRLGVMSVRHIACAAGLGEIGWNNLMIHPEIGCAVRYGGVVTEGEIKQTMLYGGEPLCRPDKCGRLCVRECPIGAISATESVGFEISDRKFYMADMDKIYCQALSVLELDSSLSKQRWTKIVEERTRENIVSLINETQTPMKRSATRLCGKCLILCPVTRTKMRI